MNLKFIQVVLVIGLIEVYCEPEPVLSIQRSLALQVLKSTLKTQQNTMVSILPLQFSLCKLASVAKGKAKEELLKAVGFTTDKMVKAFYPKFVDILKMQSSVDLTYINKIYVNHTDAIDEKFLDNSHAQYGVNVDKVSFNYPKTAASFINKKILAATYRRLEDVVQARDIDNQNITALLVIAAYYKPTWASPFNYNLTKARTFRHLGNKVSNIPLMTRVGEFFHYDARDYQVLGVPLIGMLLIFVKPTFITLERVLYKLEADPDLLKNAMSLMKEKEIKIVIPRMKIKSQHYLNGFLKNIGIKEILNSSSTGLNAILKPGVNASNIYINKVKQKLILEMDEFGVYRNRYERTQYSRPQTANLEEFVLDQPFYFTVNLGLTISDRILNGPAPPPRTENYEVFNGVFYGPE